MKKPQDPGKPPRMVRNFWIEIDIDGRKTKIAAGPRGPRGGFTMRIFQRDHGKVRTTCVVDGSEDNDTLALIVRSGDDVKVTSTKR